MIGDTNTELERLLQESLNLLRQPDSVIQLSTAQARERARYLRTQGLTYGAIAKVMGIYHGLWFSDAKWMRTCRDAGCPPKAYANGPRVPPWMRRAEA